MRRILMNVADGDECRIAVIEDGRLFEYFVDRPSQLKHVGNIYKGIIENVEPGIQAAFVDIGLERNGFLHVSDVLYGYENHPKLTDLFPRTLRIREPQPEDTVLAHHGEQHVEEVSDFVGDGRAAAANEAHADAHPPAEGATNGENGAPREAEFLDKMAEGQRGHRLTDSPQEVAPPQPEPLPEMPAAKPIAAAAAAVPPTGDKEPAGLTDVDEAEDGDEEDETGSQPGQPVQLGPDGQPLRRRRRRGRRGGRRRREAREAAARRAATQGEPAPTGVTVTSPAAEENVRQSERAPANNSAPVESQVAPAGATLASPAEQESTSAAPQTPAEPRPPRQKKRRVPKKRGGHLPKRLFEQQGDNAPPAGEPPSTGGGDGSAPPNGPALRYHRGPLPKIQNLLRRAQEVVVQVSKASQGGKGPGLTSMISLPGRYMVLTPNSQRGGVSRKIEDGSARNELRKILDQLPVPEGMGVIIRTAAINRSFDDLNRDLNYLLRLWSVITTRIADAPAPALLYSDSDPAIRTVRDYFTAETTELVIDDRAVYERVLGFFDQLMPAFKDRVKLYDKDVPLFFNEGIEGQIERIFDKKVPLKSGGYLFVEQTEALVSIDVNSGRFTSAGDAERTAFLTNSEAIPEICRQLRLRDLGGIVCCDFIDMMNARHRSEVENGLRRELRKDRARTKVARMSPFGVIEMTRQRVRPSIKAYTYVSCPTCNGFGMVHSAETMCLSLLRRMKLALGEERVQELIVQVHPHVLSHLHSEFREDIDLLEEKFDKNILFEYARDLTLGQSRFFYANDRQARVVYDMDQRINNFVRNESFKVHSNVPVPLAAQGASGVTFSSEKREGRGRRRGGRRQREKEQEKLNRQRNIQQEAQKAVSFGATLPELPPVEIIRTPTQAAADGHRPDAGQGPQGQDQHRDRGRRGRRGRGRGRDRDRGPRPQGHQQQPAAQAPAAPAAAPAPEPVAPPPQPAPAPEPVAAAPEAPAKPSRARKPAASRARPAKAAGKSKTPGKSAAKPKAKRAPRKKAE